MNELALFAGAWGGILGGHLLGWRCVCAVEIEDYPRRVLLARQRDGILPRFPIWDDVTTFDGHPWRGRVDVISGGFPCQDISAAGKGAGITGARSGLWTHMARIIGEVRPRYVLVENSPLLVSRGLDVVLSDLAALGYDASWGVIGAHRAGAPHKRDRIWIVADANQEQWGRSKEVLRLKHNLEWMGEEKADVADAMRNGQQADKGGESVSDFEWDSSPHEGRRTELESWPVSPSDVADAASKRQQRQGEHVIALYQTTDGDWEADRTIHSGKRDFGWWVVEPDVGRVAHGVASRVDRLKAIGNGQVPSVVRLAWDVLA